MSASSAQAARVILGDFALSGYATKVGVAGTIDMLETTTMVNSSRTRIPGHSDGKVSVAGYLDTDTDATAQHRQMFDMLGVATADVFSYAPTGFARGNPVILGTPREESYPIDADVGGVVGWTLDLQADDVLDLTGVSLADLAAITTDTNGTGVDNAGSSARGGAGALHVTAYSGLTSVAFKVQHSTDNSSWSDLVSFASVTAVGSERKTATGTVNRYLRAFADVTGSGSVTFQMSFARR